MNLMGGAGVSLRHLQTAGVASRKTRRRGWPLWGSSLAGGAGRVKDCAPGGQVHLRSQPAP